MDPRNNADPAPDSLDWEPPTAEETTVIREALNAHRLGESITTETGEFLITTTESGRFRTVRIEKLEGWQ